MTGTFREMSGFTVPVTTSFGAVAYASAAVRGNCSGCSTENRFTSTSGTTFAGGGTSAAGSPCALHPLRNRTAEMEITRKPISRPLFFMSKSQFAGKHTAFHEPS
jgi:hypothetical protein